MNKELGIRKRKYLNVNKFNKKKVNYTVHKNSCPLHKAVRTYVNSYINHHIDNRDILDNFYYPKTIENTITYWDSRPYKGKYEKDF